MASVGPCAAEGDVVRGAGGVRMIMGDRRYCSVSRRTLGMREFI